MEPQLNRQLQVNSELTLCAHEFFHMHSNDVTVSHIHPKDGVLLHSMPGACSSPLRMLCEIKMAEIAQSCDINANSRAAYAFGIKQLIDHSITDQRNLTSEELYVVCTSTPPVRSY